MEYGMEDFWYGMEMEWKKISSMEYGKIVFHSIPYHAVTAGTVVRQVHKKCNMNFFLILQYTDYIGSFGDTVVCSRRNQNLLIELKI